MTQVVTVNRGSAAALLTLEAVKRLEEKKQAQRGDEIDVAAQLLGEDHLKKTAKAQIKQVAVVDGVVLI